MTAVCFPRSTFRSALTRSRTRGWRVLMSCVTKEGKPNSSDATARRNTASSMRAPLHRVFFWAEMLYNQPLSRVVFEGSTPAPKSVIICVCRFKGKAPLNIHVNNVACQEIMVLAYTRHLLLVMALTRSTINMPKFRGPLPRPAAARW